MTPQRRAAQLSEEFVASYPDALALRLEWLANHLRIDRARFLRLLGLAPAAVEENLDTPWATIAQRWPDQARWVEQLLSQLIGLFGYDWTSLADRLHHLAGSAGPSQRLQTVSPQRREEILLALIGAGGPDVLDWLLEYLTLPATNGEPQAH
jgi:hypothetical protein